MHDETVAASLRFTPNMDYGQKKRRNIKMKGQLSA